MKSKILILTLLLTSLLWSDFEIYSGGTVILNNNAQIVVEGSWNNAGSFSSPTGLVTMSGSGAATFSASGDNEFYQLLINKVGEPATFTLESSMDVNNLLTITSGSIITGTNIIEMGANGYVVASPLMIDGNISGYPVTVGTSSYSNPILGVDLTAGNDIGDLEVLLFLTPTGLTEFQSILNKWSLTSTNPPAGSRDLTLSWNLSEDNSIDLNNIQAWKTPDEGTTWFQVGAPTTTSGNPRSITVAGVTSLSDWTVGEPIFTSTDEEIDFGDCTQNSTQTQQITITNETLSIISGTVEISAPFSVAIVSDQVDRGSNASILSSAANRTSKSSYDNTRNTIDITAIPPGGSVDLDITYDPTTLGTHDDILLLSFSGSANPSKEILVTGVSIGIPEITVDPLTLDYGYIEVGTTSSQQFTIQNTGNALLEGYITTPSGFTVSLASDSDSSSSRHNLSDHEFNSNSEIKNSELHTEADEISEFETDNRATVYYSVVAGETNTYNLNFTPVAVADYSGTVTISDNCPETDFSISVTAHGDVPNLDVTPASFDVTLTNFETTTETLTLTNTSNIEVNYTAFVYTETVVPLDADLWTGTVNWSTYTDFSEARGHYDEDGWMMFDISSIPDNATILGAIFHGYVNSSYAPALSITPISTPPPGTPPVTLHNDIVAEGNYQSACYIYENQQLIPTGWYEDELAGFAAADIQSALTQNWFALGICERTNNPAYFINFDGWNETNPPYLTIAYTLPSDLEPWLTIDDDTAVTGSIPAVDNVDHTMGFDPSLVGDGTYTTNILIVSNDTDEREQLIPVTLTVETPVITVDPSSIDFGDILVGEISTEQFTIENTGTATLSGSITTPTGYSVVLAGADNSSFGKKLESTNKDNRNVLTFDIDTGTTLTYDLTFAPTAVADYNGNVVVSHNALGGSDTIAVTGAGVEPDIDVSPTSFAFTIQEHETDSEALTISNIGGYQLTFSGSVDYGLDTGSKKEESSDAIDSWLSLDGSITTSGTVSPGGSTPVIVGFDPSSLADGIYTAFINISSDDPDEATVSVQVDMTVSTSGITVSPLTFDFGYVAVGEMYTQQFTIENTGNALLEGTILEIDCLDVSEASDVASTAEMIKNSMINPTDDVGFFIPALSSITYDLTFIPISAIDYSGTITITHNAAPPDVDLQITAFGEVPDIDVSPTSLSKTLPNNETGTEELTISNSGAVDLDYDASIEYLAPDSDLSSQPFSGNDVIFDSQYYTDSRQGGEDIASAISIASLPYIGSGTTADYNNDYDEACTFTGSTAPDVVYSYTPAAPELVTIDLCGSSYDTKVYIYENDETTAIACNDDFYASGDPCGSYVSALFDISLTPGNTYYIVVDGYGTNSGDYDIDVSKKIFSWLTLDNQASVSGSVIQGNPDVITAGFDPDGLSDGTYNANIVIDSNDPDESQVMVPVSFTVSTPGITVSPGSLDFGDVLVDQSSTLQFSIENSGTAQLTGDITTPSGYSVAIETDNLFDLKKQLSDDPVDSRNVISYNISGGQTQYYDLTFSPVSEIAYNGDVTISHNTGGGDEIIPVTGTGITIELGLNPTSFNESAYEGNTVNTTFTVSNTGSSNLTYNANVVYNTDDLTTVSVYPLTVARGTGATDGTTITQTSLVDCTYPQDGWMMFDVSSIPLDAIIQSVTFNGYVNDTNYPFWRITPVSSDPLTADPAVLHADIVAEAINGFYLMQNEASGYAAGWKQHLLGGAVVQDIQSTLSSGIFTVGIVGQDGSASYFIIFDGWNESNIPYLEIEYVMPGDFWMELNGSQAISGSVSPSGSDIIAVQMDTNSLLPDTYSASINGTSNDPDNPIFSIPVSFTVLQVLDAPENATVEVEGSTVTISWDAVPGATMYHVYSSDSPDGSFTEETGGNFSSGSRESWTKTYSPVAEKLFYIITADDIVTDNISKKLK